MSPGQVARLRSGQAVGAQPIGAHHGAVQVVGPGLVCRGQSLLQSRFGHRV
ncbi:hypothetical protein [Nocardiopsis xinjiangensis]|uniref:hypothetical protein n=1 Tax=Nocardiopsis xinjiangensis TaxID=124285 RepID=UPI0013784D51|nr:hypothetical protein [Nocardiopsis xinjiangensis]